MHKFQGKPERGTSHSAQENFVREIECSETQLRKFVLTLLRYIPDTIIQEEDTTPAARNRRFEGDDLAFTESSRTYWNGASSSTRNDPKAEPIKVLTFRLKGSTDIEFTFSRPEVVTLSQMSTSKMIYTERTPLTERHYKWTNETPEQVWELLGFPDLKKCLERSKRLSLPIQQHPSYIGVMTSKKAREYLNSVSPNGMACGIFYNRSGQKYILLSKMNYQPSVDADDYKEVVVDSDTPDGMKNFNLQLEVAASQGYVPVIIEPHRITLGKRYLIDCYTWHELNHGEKSIEEVEALLSESTPGTYLMFVHPEHQRLYWAVKCQDESVTFVGVTDREFEVEIQKAQQQAQIDFSNPLKPIVTDRQYMMKK